MNREPKNREDSTGKDRERFTPGKWHIVANDDVMEITTVKRELKRHCSIAKVGVFYWSLGKEDKKFNAEQRANAHLIAAAPEMYAMLARKCDDCVIHKDFCGQCETGSILKKARGEQ